MIHSRKIGNLEFIQIVEFVAPTHDLEWMLPGIPRPAYDANASWLEPNFWMSRTNRLVFAMQLFVLKVDSHVILLDTGVGNGKKRLSPHQTMINTPALEWLAAIGAPADKVTHVVHTHLHGDHVGWNTRDDGGRWVPTFPNAKYFSPAEEWTEFKRRHDAGELGSHDAPFVDSVLPIMEAGLLKCFAPGDEVADCLEAVAAPGHTRGQVTFRFRNGCERYIFSADVLHSPIQVRYPAINSRWCELPEQARSTRLALMHEAASTDATVFPAHAIGVEGWRILRQGDDYTVQVGARATADNSVWLQSEALTKAEPLPTRN